MKVASIEKRDGHVALFIGRQQLRLDHLPAERIEWLSRLSTPLLVEVDLQGPDVVALGKVLPHPRVAALRAASDSRFAAVLEALGELDNETIEHDLALLGARMRAHFGLAHAASGEADFALYCRHSAATAHDLAEAFRRVPQTSHPACVPDLVRRIESMDVELLRPIVVTVGHAPWSAETLLRTAEELANERSSGLLDEAEELVEAARGRGDDHARMNAILARVEKSREWLAKRAKQQAAKLLASRPRFEDVDALFGIELPAALRAAWERHYEGDTVGFGFIEAQTGKLEKLTKLSIRLQKDLEKAERLDGNAAGIKLEELPFRLLPFGTGEHGDEYFALDLARPTRDGDFAVVVVFERRGEAWQTHPSSAEWLAGDGVTRD